MFDFGLGAMIKKFPFKFISLLRLLIFVCFESACHGKKFWIHYYKHERKLGVFAHRKCIYIKIITLSANLVYILDHRFQ